LFFPARFYLPETSIYMNTVTDHSRLSLQSSQYPLGNRGHISRYLFIRNLCFQRRQSRRDTGIVPARAL